MPAEGNSDRLQIDPNYTGTVAEGAEQESVLPSADVDGAQASGLGAPSSGCPGRSARGMPSSAAVVGAVVMLLAGICCAY